MTCIYLLKHMNMRKIAKPSQKQMECEIKGREKEVEMQQSLLKANLKVTEQERHRVAKELAERQNKVRNLQIKYKALIQR